MYFGGTEMTATASDISSGNSAQTTLEFSVDHERIFFCNKKDRDLGQIRDNNQTMIIT